jgi:prophage maintenance system killer protein
MPVTGFPQLLKGVMKMFTQPTEIDPQIRPRRFIQPRINSSSLSDFLLPQSDSRLSALLMDYYEGEDICLRIDQANVEEMIEILEEYIEVGGWEEKRWETVDPRVLLKRCKDVQKGAPPFYLQASKMRGVPLREIPLYIHRVIHPGILFDKTGTRGHFLEKYSIQEIEKNHELVAPYFAQGEAMSQKLADPDSKGIRMGLQGLFSNYDVIVHVNAKKKKNHKAAFAYLEKVVVQGSSFSSQTSEEILHTLKETHRLIEEGMISNPGKLRTKNILVFEDMPERTQENLEQIIWKKGGTRKEIKAFRSALEKNNKYGNSFVDYLTKEEKEAVSLVAYIGPSPKKIQQLLKRFAGKLKEKEKTLNDISLAVFAHKQIGRIHPFSDENGRVARAFMNAILMRGGYDPVVFPSDKEYTEMIQKEAKEPGSFEAYLRDKIVPWNRENRKRITSIF